MSKQGTTLFLSLVALATYFLVPLLIGQANFVARDKTPTASTPVNAPARVSASTDSPSSKPEDMALAQEIDRVIETSDSSHTRFGVFVTSMKDGRVICSHHGDELFTPASNMKVYTTAVALDLLGADYHWRTSVYADKQPDAEGLIDGNLTLYGRGAPDLKTKSLASLADQIYQRGLRRV